MGCFGSKTDSSAVVAVKPPSTDNKQAQAVNNMEEQWNVSSTVKQLNKTATGNLSQSNRESNGESFQQQRKHQKKKSAADEQQGYWNEAGGPHGTSTAGLAAANIHDDSSPMVKMQSNYASNNSSTMKVGPSVQEHLPDDGDDFEEYMQQMKRNEEQREQLKSKHIGKQPLNITPPMIVPVQKIQFAHENQDRVREHAAQILKNSEAVKQMSKNTFQLPPLNANVQKKMRKDNEQQLTDDFYKMLQNKKNIELNQQDHEGFDFLEAIPQIALQGKKKSRKDELENLLCELKDEESGSNVSVAGSRRHQFSDRNLMDDEQPMILTNRTNNMASSLPAIQPQKKAITQIKEIDFEGQISNDPFMSPYVDQFMNVHKNSGVVSPKGNILIAGANPLPSMIHKVNHKPNRYGQYNDDDEEEEEDELDF